MTPVLPTCTKQPEQGPKPTGRVLTSRENMMLMEEKERVKKEEALEKEVRLKAREEKRLKKAREKERKVIARKGGKGRNSRLFLLNINSIILILFLMQERANLLNMTVVTMWFKK